MQDWLPNKPGMSLEELEIALWYNEVLCGRTLKIGTAGPDGAPEGPTTWSLHDYTPVAPKSLELILDPDGGIAAPEGYEPVTKGEAFVSNEKKKVALFRKVGVPATNDAGSGSNEGGATVDSGDN